jgi:cytochrome c peroxidase
MAHKLSSRVSSQKVPKSATARSGWRLLQSWRLPSIIVLVLFAASALAVADGSNLVIPRFQEFPDPDGSFANLNLGGPTDTSTNPFFQDLGTNGRRCVTCHEPGDAFTVTPPHIRQRFAATQGTDPIFRPVDGATCPTADVSTLEERREAYSLLLDRGLIRIGIAVPANANFKVVSVYNRYGCNATDVISMYRRPLPTTNLPFLSTVMFDGRESSPLTGTTKITYSNYPTSLMSDLAHQSVDATTGHAQGDGTRPTPTEQQEIVDFETRLFTAQIHDHRAGHLNRDGALGGPGTLSTQPFFISVNSSVHFLVPTLELPGGLATPGDGQFTSNIFGLYDKWAQATDDDGDERDAARRSIARGEVLFNTLQIPITGVAGINDDVTAGGLVAGGIPTLQGTCGTCHDTPNVGNHSFPTPLNIGTGDPNPADGSVNLGGLDVSYLPEITVCKTDPSSGLASNNCKTTTDLGQALVDGNFDHVGKIKGPILRGLAARAPLLPQRVGRHVARRHQLLRHAFHAALVRSAERRPCRFFEDVVIANTTNSRGSPACGRRDHFAGGAAARLCLERYQKLSKEERLARRDGRSSTWVLVSLRMDHRVGWVLDLKLRKCLKKWWTRRDSNPRPPRCERGALPAELLAHEQQTNFSKAPQPCQPTPLLAVS